MTSLYDFSFTSIDGEPLPLTGFRDRAVLVVNTASACGLTPQYDGLEALYSKYREQGLTVLRVPCNQFMGQEPGTEAEIKAFCDLEDMRCEYDRGALSDASHQQIFHLPCNRSVDARQRLVEHDQTRIVD